MTPSKVLLDRINKLRECFSSTTAALAPYPVTAVQGKKKRIHKVVEHSSTCFGVESNDGLIVKQFWKTREAAQKVCDELNGKYNEQT